MWLTGLVAPWHVGSSQTRARTREPCIGRQILNHCATREALLETFNNLQVGGFAATDLYCLITFLKNRTDILASIISIAV